jgi:hypothetical protein
MPTAPKRVFHLTSSPSHGSRAATSSARRGFWESTETTWVKKRTPSVVDAEASVTNWMTDSQLVRKHHHWLRMLERIVAIADEDLPHGLVPPIASHNLYLSGQRDE